MFEKVLWGFERSFSKKSVKFPLLISLLATLLFLHLGLPHIKLIQGEGHQKELFYNDARLKLFHQAHITRSEGPQFHYRIQYEKGFLSLKKIELKATGCLNGISFESSSGEIIKVPLESECFQEGFVSLEIPDSIKNSNFNLIFEMKTTGDSRTIHLQYFNGWPLDFAFYLFIVLTGLFLFYLLRFESRFIRYLLPLGFNFYASNFLSLDVDAWSYDSLGHLDHVKTVLSGNLIPKDICWECFQPPLSYWLSAFFYKLSFVGTSWSVAAASRFSSLLCFIVFLYYGLKYLQLYLEDGISRVLVAGILVFYPTSIIHAIRVGNESFFYAAFMAALFYLSRFCLMKSFLDLKSYTWSTVIALYSKATALVLGPLSFLVLLTQFKSFSFSREKKKFLGALWPLLFFLPLFFVMQKYKANFIQRLGAMNPLLGVKNDFVNLFGIDVQDLLTRSFTDTWHDVGGRQYFWNFYLKSMSWGEFDWGSVESLARIWNVFNFLLVFYLIFASRFYFIKKGEEVSRKVSLSLPLLSCAVCVLSSFSYRLKYPLSPMQDFRFLYPLLFPLGVVFVRFSDALSPRVTFFLLSFAGILLTMIWAKVLYLS